MVGVSERGLKLSALARLHIDSCSYPGYAIETKLIVFHTRPTVFTFVGTLMALPCWFPAMIVSKQCLDSKNLLESGTVPGFFSSTENQWSSSPIALVRWCHSLSHNQSGASFLWDRPAHDVINLWKRPAAFDGDIGRLRSLCAGTSPKSWDFICETYINGTTWLLIIRTSPCRHLHGMLRWPAQNLTSVRLDDSFRECLRLAL
jgi:hypothetical protein